jgi:hypothetical protein
MQRFSFMADPNDPRILGQRVRCPYTLRPLVDIPSKNIEHIFPYAIGGPASYAVAADKGENSWFGTNVDAPFVDSHFIRLARLLLGIQGRSGVPNLRLDGKTEVDQRPVKLTISPDGTHEYRSAKPFEFDRATGKGSIIVNSKDAEREIKRLTEIYTKKNLQIRFGKPKALGRQKIKGELKLNLLEIRAGILKIAYLAAFEFLGDRFLDDPMNGEWQKGIRHMTVESRAGIRLRGQAPFLDRHFLDVVLPHLDHHQHAVAVFCVQRLPVVIVKLFNWELLTACCLLSETSTFGLTEGEGRIVKCDALARQVQTRPFIDHVVETAPKFFGP